MLELGDRARKHITFIHLCASNSNQLKKREGGLIIWPLRFRFRESKGGRRGARFRLKICLSAHYLSPPECNFLDQELADIF